MDGERGTFFGASLASAFAASVMTARFSTPSFLSSSLSNMNCIVDLWVVSSFHACTRTNAHVLSPDLYRQRVTDYRTAQKVHKLVLVYELQVNCVDSPV